MSPVAKSSGHAGKALMVASVGVVLALGLAFAVAVLANRGHVDVRLGDDEFNAGRVDKLAAPIEDRGPIIYPDAAFGGRPIFVQHLGDDPVRGWSAFGAEDPKKAGCVVQWNERSRTFSGCGTTYPEDGTGLRQYPTKVRGGRVYVDLHG